MKVNELRVGSLLQIKNQIIAVGKIDEDFISWKYDIKDRSFWNPYISLKDERLKPIELTEEILLKCGFEKKQSYINGVGLCVFFENKKFNYRLNEFFEVVLLKIKLKNLHQLQNLYFALTGEELEIKL